MTIPRNIKNMDESETVAEINNDSQSDLDKDTEVTGCSTS